MILYRIIRKSDGKAFYGFDSFYGKQRWGGEGILLKRPESIAKHLKRLCFDYEKKHYGWENCQFYWAPKNIIPDMSRLKNYKVEKLTVMAAKTDSIAANDFIETIKLAREDWAKLAIIAR